MRALITLLLNAVALWLTAAILPGLHVEAFGDGGTAAIVLTYVLLALIWGVVNATLGAVLHIVSLPLYLLTLGLFAFIVNGVLFWFVGLVSSWVGFGLSIDGFWWAVLAAIVMSILSSILGAVFNHASRGR